MLHTPNMKGLYRFEGNSTDGSGNAHNGTDTAITYVTGRFGKGASFDGTTSYIDFGDVADFDFGTGDFTFALHVYRDNVTNSATLFAKGDITLPSGYALYIERGVDGNFIKFAANNNAAMVTSASAIADLVWRHIAFTRSGGTIQIYVDGKPDGASGTYTGDFTNALSAIAGRWSHTASGFLAGKEDELIVLRKALSTSDIRRIMLGLHPLGG